MQRGNSNRIGEVKGKFMTCGICGVIAGSSTYGVCPNCMQEDQKLFEVVRDAIKVNEIVTMETIRKKTGIDTKTIKRWVDTGRLKLSQ